MSDQVEILAAVLDKTGALIANVRPDQASLPTPCSGFDVTGLVDHLVEWLTTFATGAAGEPPPAPADDDAGWPERPANRFRQAAAHAVAAFRGGALDREVPVSAGALPGRMVLGMMLMEYQGHGWDLATATGQPVPYSEEEAEAALAAGRPMLVPEYRGPDKPFGHEVPVPPDASAVDRLIGFLGRQPAGAGSG